MHGVCDVWDLRGACPGLTVHVLTWALGLYHLLTSHSTVLRNPLGAFPFFLDLKMNSRILEALRSASVSWALETAGAPCTHWEEGGEARAGCVLPETGYGRQHGAGAVTCWTGHLHSMALHNAHSCCPPQANL